MTNSETNKIVEMLKSKDEKEKGFRLLMREYGEKLYWHIRRIVVTHDDAEDVMQETVINVYSHIDKFRGDSSLITWIYRIATNEALRWLKKQSGMFRSIDSNNIELADKIEAQCDIDAKETEVIFQKALLTLPTQQRIAFNMRYYDEMSYEEIASISGKNVNTLKTNYHFAVQRIKDYIKENAI